MTSQAFDPGSCAYVSLVTFRRTGAEVATPVWIAGSNSRYYVFSEGRAGKVKRLRNNSAVRLAECDFRGRVRGEWHDGVAAIVTEPTVIDSAYRALRSKYGWQLKIGDFFSRLSGRYDARAMIEIALN
jgi:hypothetical protein